MARLLGYLADDIYNMGIALVPVCAASLCGRSKDARQTIRPAQGTQMPLALPSLSHLTVVRAFGSGGRWPAVVFDALKREGGRLEGV